MAREHARDGHSAVTACPEGNPKTGAHDARVKAVGAQLRRRPGQLAREQNVAQLRGAIDTRGVGPLRLQVVETQASGLVHAGRDGHDAAAGKMIAEQVGEQERRSRSGVEDSLSGLPGRDRSRGAFRVSPLNRLCAEGCGKRQPAERE